MWVLTTCLTMQMSFVRSVLILLTLVMALVGGKSFSPPNSSSFHFFSLSFRRRFPLDFTVLVQKLSSLSQSFSFLGRFFGSFYDLLSAINGV